jgi:hypothetical protein
MPTQPNPQPLVMWPHQANVPAEGMSISVQIQSDGTGEPDLDAVLQDLIDYLQDWPGRHPDANVTGQKYDVLLYAVTPTDPIQVIQPEPEPEGP